MQTINSVLSAVSLGFASAAIAVSSLLAAPAIAASPAKAATTQETQALTQLLKNSKQFKVCADSLDMASAQRASRAYKVNDQSYFVMVQCFLAAYQGNYEFFLYSPNAQGNAVKPLMVTEFSKNELGKIEKIESSSIGGLPTYNPNQRLLTVQTKYRGVGDCGSIGRYRLENNALKLVDFKAKFECDGKMQPFQQVFPPK